MEKIYHKLIRDRIPEIIEQTGQICVTRVLEEEEYLDMVNAKLHEELAEYQADQNLEELADLLEVLYAAAEAHGFTREQLEQARSEKEAQRGAFRKRLLLLEVRNP